MANGSMSAGDIPNSWSNTVDWYNQSSGGSTLHWDNIITTTGTTPINTTPNITIPNYPGTQMEIDWEAIRRRLEIPGELINTSPLTREEAELRQLEMRRLELEIQMRRAGTGIPALKKVVPRKPLRMIRLREDAKVS